MERYSSDVQGEVEAALGKVASLAGYRDLLRGKKAESAGKVVENNVACTGSGARELQPIVTT